MKKVVRYKCDYCRRIAAKPETIEHHEKECIHNPNGRNCYVCKHSVQGGWMDLPYGGDRFDENVPYCDLHREPLEILRNSGYNALNCQDFERCEEMFYCRQGEK